MKQFSTPGKIRAALDFPADARRFSSFKNALIESGHGTGITEVRWAAMVDGNRMGVGITGKDGMFTVRFDFESGSIERVQCEQYGHSCLRTLIIDPQDRLVLHPCQWAVNAQTFTIAFQGEHAMMMSDQTFQPILWDVEESSGQSEYQLELSVIDRRARFEISSERPAYRHDYLLESLSVQAKSPPRLIYIFEENQDDKNLSK